MTDLCIHVFVIGSLINLLMNYFIYLFIHLFIYKIIGLGTPVTSVWRPSWVRTSWSCTWSPTASQGSSCASFVTRSSRGRINSGRYSYTHTTTPWPSYLDLDFVSFLCLNLCFYLNLYNDTICFYHYLDLYFYLDLVFVFYIDLDVDFGVKEEDKT